MIRLRLTARGLSLSSGFSVTAASSRLNVETCQGEQPKPSGPL